VAHPYRTRPAEPETRAAEVRLDVSSVGFGLVCGIVGQALAGPRCALVATVVGVVLIVRWRGGGP
jgi:hypothetical protein